jgi:calcium-dependent protein kinase
MLYGKYGLECDVWSMGVLIYYMVSGTHPFDGDTIQEITQNVLQSEYDVPDASPQC